MVSEGNQPSPALDPAGAAQPDGEVRWDLVRKILSVVNGRWSLDILSLLADAAPETIRQAELLRKINGDLDRAERDDARAEGGAERRLHKKVLIETTDRLEGARMIGRQYVPGYPPETHYFLTAAGREILTEIGKLGRRGGWVEAAGSNPHGVEAANSLTRLPTPAGVWNALLGGKDNFEPDRRAATAALEAMPELRAVAQLVRLFQASAVQRLVEAGVRQFLDIGTGLPVAGSVHEVAQALAPECRVVYVDNDPRVLTHARALLTSTPEGSCDYIDADLRDPGAILARAAQTLDLSRPTAVLLMAVLHFVPDGSDPWAVVSRLMDGIRGEAYLALTHAASDLSPSDVQMAERYNTEVPVSIWMRGRDEVTRFFAGMQMLGPGLITLGEWFPDNPIAAGSGMAGHVGIGRRPALR